MEINKKIISPFNFFGSLFFYVFFLVIFLIHIFHFSFLFFSLLLAYLITIVSRLSIEKERPIRKKSKNIFELIKARSFPSMHSTRITILGFFICYIFGHIWSYIVAVIFVFLVSYSRIIRKEHDIYDVFGGIFLGIVVSFIVLVTLSKIF